MLTRVALLFALASTALLAVTVSMGGYDSYRSNANTAETLLTRSFVGSASFGFVGAYAVDGAVYAQPLIVENVSGRTIIVILTMHDTVYAFDASDPAAGTHYLWKRSVGTPFTIPQPISADYHEFPNGEIGCLATPVVNTATRVLYAECLDNTSGHTLIALNLTDGSDYHSPAIISATSSGITFNSALQKNHAGLLYANGKVYTAFASTGNDIQPYYGWVMAYDSSTLALSNVWCSSCAAGSGGGGDGIWMSGGGLSADSSGNVYLITGNGSWDGISEYGESFVKLSPALSLLDFFTPTNWATLNAGDTDLGSSRALLLDDTHIFGMGKDGNAWVLNASNMGHLQSGGIGPSQNWSISPGDLRNYYAYANGSLFLGGASAAIRAYSWSGSAFNTTPTATATVSSPVGYALSYSSNGASDGIVWTTTTASSAFSSLQPGTLRALNASTLAEIWNSDTSLGNIAKFVPPVVANGKVYMASFSNQVVVYGTLPKQTQISGSVVAGAAIQ